MTDSYDMTVSACAERYNKRRHEILELIRGGKISASLSCIEYYPADFSELGNDLIAIKNAMTWNGSEYIDRPDWREEYEDWLKHQEG